MGRNRGKRLRERPGKLLRRDQLLFEIRLPLTDSVLDIAVAIGLAVHRCLASRPRRTVLDAGRQAFYHTVRLEVTAVVVVVAVDLVLLEDVGGQGVLRGLARRLGQRGCMGIGCI